MKQYPYLLTSDSAEGLYTAYKAEGNGDALFCAEESPRFCDIRNPYRVLLTPQGKRLLDRAATDDCFLSEAHSDYENFTVLLTLLPSLVGSGYHSFVRLTVEALFGRDAIPSPDDAAGLWKSTLPRFETGELHALLPPFMSVRVASLSEWVTPNAERLAAYDSLEAYEASVSAVLEGTVLAELDLTGVAFRSPDPYHARLGFSAVKSGGAEDEERTILTSQLIRKAGEYAKKQGIPVLLSGETAPALLREMIAYLERADRLPRLFLGVRLHDVGALDRYCRTLEHEGLLESFDAVLPQELATCGASALSESLRILAMHEPIGRLCFLSKGETDAAVCMEYERFLRILSDFFSEAVERRELSAADAVRVMRGIMTGRALLK